MILILFLKDEHKISAKDFIHELYWNLKTVKNMKILQISFYKSNTSETMSIFHVANKNTYK
jgi:hypothetical protein